MAKKRKLEPIHIGIAIVAIFVLSQTGILNQLFAVGEDSRQITNEQCTFDLFNDTNEQITIPCEEIETWLKEHPWAWMKENVMYTIGIFAGMLLMVYLLYVPEKR